MPNDILYLDFETYSPVDLSKSGMAPYMEHPDFQVLLCAYAINNDQVTVISPCEGEPLPDTLINALQDSDTIIAAHNAAFERSVLQKLGIHTRVGRYDCSMIGAAYAGLPMSLSELSKAIGLDDNTTKLKGDALIRFFCTPSKTKGRTRNLPHHDAQKWYLFKQYCERDVVAEREVHRYLKRYPIPRWERDNYVLDQYINDAGVLVDRALADAAVAINERSSQAAQIRIQERTGLDNPNSLPQLKSWLSEQLGYTVSELTGDSMPDLINEATGAAKEVLELRIASNRTSTSKYEAMHRAMCSDDRARNLFQFYGASRTGRWAGRLIQLQNLPRNKMEGAELEMARQLVLSGDTDAIELIWGDVTDTLSQLIRTAFIAPPGKSLVVADFSAIEARVIAWLAGEKWRLQVFATHGKIYEASASKMFGVPLDKVDKELRQKGKVAELALGYQGAQGALIAMGAERMGLSESEMDSIVKAWRAANPAIVEMWGVIEEAAINAVERPGAVMQLEAYKELQFCCTNGALRITLPSGRDLYYQQPRAQRNHYNRKALTYLGVEQTTRRWAYIDTYGGKLTENVVQAIARDLLADSMQRVRQRIVMHVHDEIVAEVDGNKADEALADMVAEMGKEVKWAKGLPLRADGYTTKYYHK